MGQNGMVNWELGPGLRSSGLPNRPEPSAVDAVADHAGECQARWATERETKERGVAREHAWLGVGPSRARRDPRLGAGFSIQEDGWDCGKSTEAWRSRVRDKAKRRATSQGFRACGGGVYSRRFGLGVWSVGRGPIAAHGHVVQPGGSR